MAFDGVVDFTAVDFAVVDFAADFLAGELFAADFFAGAVCVVVAFGAASVVVAFGAALLLVALLVVAEVALVAPRVAPPRPRSGASEPFNRPCTKP